MKLIYHKGKNFGDAINPMIFEKLFGDLMRSEDENEVVGIGSILGHARPTSKTSKFFVYSSGFAGGDEGTYGKAPIISDKYEILCVRGKKTAKALGIPESLAIADGALLISRLIDIPIEEKLHDFAYMPHIGSLDLYDNWPGLVADCGIHFIDPRKEPMQVLKEMQQSKVLITEAMHGAIIADALQIPWIPVKTNKTINAFKWEDYLETVDLEYKPHDISTLYSNEFLKELFKSKLSKYKMSLLSPLAAALYSAKQKRSIKKVMQKFESLKVEPTYNCTSVKLKQKQDDLLAAAERLKKMI
jgi:succinoglycan biosynthesis protein ExoV